MYVCVCTVSGYKATKQEISCKEAEGVEHGQYSVRAPSAGLELQNHLKYLRYPKVQGRGKVLCRGCCGVGWGGGVGGG